MGLRIGDPSPTSAPGEGAGQAAPGTSAPPAAGTATPWTPPAAPPPPSTASSSFAPAPARTLPPYTATELGYLSAKYESSADASAVGWDSTGGASYGLYQLATSNGSIQAFLQWLKAQHPALAQRLADPPGTPAFSAAWKALAKSDGPAFVEAQNEYFLVDRYLLAAGLIRQATGLDIFSAPLPLQQALWSTTVQHGVGGARSVFQAALALQRSNPSTYLDWSTGAVSVDAGRLIHDLYFERGLTGAHGEETRFRASTEAVQRSVADRFSDERTEALVEYLGPALAQVTAAQAMSSDVTAFRSSDSVAAARSKLVVRQPDGTARLSADATYGHPDFPVVDAQGKPLGVVSNRALLSADLAPSAPVGALVRRGPVIVPGAMTLDQVAETMSKSGVGHVLVVDEQGRLAGIVSATDLLKARGDTPPATPGSE